MVKIRFISQGANSVLGGFASGDVANVSEIFAAHLVNEARVAEYVQAVVEVKAEPKRARKGKV